MARRLVKKTIVSLTENISNTITDISGNSFTYTIYPNPIRKTYKEKKELIKFFGNRKLKDGTPCLGITENVVKNGIKDNTYDAFIHVKNNAPEIEDSATCSLQYYNWCDPTNDENKQLWINDLCRQTTSSANVRNKPKPSPTAILFDVVKKFSLDHSIVTNYIMVETEYENGVVNPGAQKLIEIYTGYGFQEDDTCKFDRYIIMKKNLLGAPTTNNATGSIAPTTYNATGSTDNTTTTTNNATGSTTNTLSTRKSPRFATGGTRKRYKVARHRNKIRAHSFTSSLRK